MPTLRPQVIQRFLTSAKLCATSASSALKTRIRHCGAHLATARASASPAYDVLSPAMARGFGNGAPALRRTIVAGVAVLGTGAWGTTLARMIAFERLRLATKRERRWRSHALGASPRAGRRDAARARESRLPAGIRSARESAVTADLAEAVRDRTWCCSSRLRSICASRSRIAPLLAPGTVVASASKGLELGTRLRMSQVLKQELPAGTPIAALSGPNLALEIARGLPAAAVVASDSHAAAESGARGEHGGISASIPATTCRASS